MAATDTDELAIEFEDFDKICRFCYKRSHYLKSIFDENDEKPDAYHGIETISETMDTVAMLQINLALTVHYGDGLPECICSNCYDQLVISNNFRRQCHTATDHLNKIRLAYEMERKISIKLEVTPFDDNVSSGGEDMFNDPGGPVDPSHGLLDEIKPETVDAATELNAPTAIKRPRGRPRTRPDPQPKKETKKVKAKEKKARDKNQLKEKRKQVCPICGMLVSFLPYHLEVHDPSIFYDCDICGHRAPSRTVIINHFRNKHFSKREHTCPHCSLTFTQALSLKRHLSVHSGEKNFKCECGKSYRQIDSLKAHRKRHLEPTIPCPYCTKHFYTKNELKSHVGIHTGEKPFKCDICPAAFVASSSLAAHRRQHKKDNILPSCKLCGMEFSDRLLLTMHMYDHKHKRWVNAPE